MFFEVPAINRQGLRRFGIMMGAIIAIFFGLILPWLRDSSISLYPWVIALALWIFALLAPNFLRPIYYSWMRLGGLLGEVNAHIILGIIFYVLVTPMSLFLRLSGKDPMMRDFELESCSYRQVSLDRDPLSMEKPY